MSANPFVRKAAPAPGEPGTHPAGTSSPGLWLEQHRYSVLAAGGVGVVALALWSRYQHKGDPSADPSSTAAGYGVPVAGTTATDVYNAIEPLTERLSGYDGFTQLVAGQQNIVDAIGKISVGSTSGGGVSTPAPAPHTPAPTGSKVYVLTQADMPTKDPNWFANFAKRHNVSPTLLYTSNPGAQTNTNHGQGWRVGSQILMPTGPGTTYADDAKIAAYFKSLTSATGPKKL